MSLNSIADPSSGPALLKGLRVISWPEAEEQTAEALGRIHYELAAPEILSRMQSEPREARQQVYFARALASLRYQPVQYQPSNSYVRRRRSFPEIGF